MKLRAALIFIVAVMLLGRSAWSQNPPKWEVPLDYSYVHFQAIDFTSQNYFFGQHYDLNGGGGGLVYNFSHMFGFKAEFQGYGSQTRTITVPAGNPFFPAGASASVQGNLFTYMFGPQIKIYKGRFHPFAEGLVGGAHSNVYKNAINNLNFTGISKAPSNNTFALATGVGFDIAVSPRVSIRPFEMDYMYTNFNGNLGLTANQNSWRYLGGAVLTFGGKPPIPPTASCSVSPTEIWSGDPVTATMTDQNFNPKHTITYSWSGTGVKVSGTTQTGNVDTTGLAPGSYTVTGTATDAKEKKNNMASCTASFTVKQPRPPVATCSVSPDTVKPGDSFVFTVSAESPDNSALTYSYTTSAGNISGTGNSATEATSTANAGSAITATANIVDARGLSTTCSAVVNVSPLPVVTVPEVSEVGECKFNQSNKPGRVDNECKAVLDDVALRVQREPNDTLVVVGYTDEQETVKMTQLAGQRAVNVKYYLTSGEGGAQIDPSRIQVRAGTVKDKSAKLYIVPAGATFTEESTAVDETQVKGQPRNGSAKKSKKAAAAPSN